MVEGLVGRLIRRIVYRSIERCSFHPAPFLIELPDFHHSVLVGVDASILYRRFWENWTGL